MLTYYGLWSASQDAWLLEDGGLVVHSVALSIVRATCQTANRLYSTDWQAKIIGDDGLPVDLPED